MLKKSIFWFFLLVNTCLFAALPDLSPRLVREKIYQILQIHVSEDSINEELSQRVLENFLEEIDPLKIYFTKKDIEPWLEPSKELLSQLSLDLKYAKYNLFYEIQDKLIWAIERRKDLEQAIEKEPLKKDLEAVSWEKLDWAKDVSELKERFILMKSLYHQTAEKLDEEGKKLYVKMLAKRRSLREQEIASKDPSKKEKWSLVQILKAFCSSLDANTSYFTPVEAMHFMTQVQQRLFGIGALLKDSLDGFTVVSLVEGGPASITGELKIQDRIIAVNSEPVVGLSLIEAVEKIRGEKGTNVTLTVLREKSGEKSSLEKLDISLTRDEVVLEETRMQSQLEPFADGVIAHLKLFSFYQDQKTSSSKDLKASLEKIQKEENLQGVILDLRNNSGGILDEAVNVCSLFMGNGIVVSVKDNHGHIHHLRARNGKAFWDGPLLILTNKSSASAAEIVAGTLQDYGKALVVGDKRTFGKGTFQTYTADAKATGKVNTEGEFRVTRGVYYTVSGKSPQLVGVIPDVIVPGILDELDIGEAFNKFPVANDAISPNFSDDLADIPLIQRRKLGRLYQKHLQKKVSFYQGFRELLQKNSRKRIDQNKNYQNFLAECKKQQFDAKAVELFGLADLQFLEALNVMKDLLAVSAPQEIDS